MAISSPIFQVTDKGITAPTYYEILEYFKDKARKIFGDDIVLDDDTQDGQLLGIFAAAINDMNAQAIEVFSAYNPQTAYGVALDGAIKTNGITRRKATHSTADLKLVGQFGTVIQNGKARDNFDNLWDLPASVTIPATGEITVTATAEKAGAVTAVAGSIRSIATPTRGWQTVTNEVDALVGKDEETDAELREKQTQSTMLPSMAIWDALVSAVRQLDGVVSVSGRHNDTGQTSDDGIPAHSIALVVEGGDAQAIVEMIYFKKSQGVATYGTTSLSVIDSLGNVQSAKFSRPNYVPVAVAIKLKAAATWMSTVEDEIKQHVSDYVNSLAIGEDVDAAKVASSIVWDKEFYSSFSLKSLTLNGSTASVDVKWNAKATCTPSAVTITVVS